MVNMRDINAGDIVKIVDAWDPEGRCRENGAGRMDHWLGQIMTVRRVCGDSCSMVEDEGEYHGTGWIWNSYCIDHIVEDDLVSADDMPDIDLFLQ